MHHLLKKVVFISCLASSAHVFADITYVDIEATGSETGLNWQDAFPLLEQALAAARAPNSAITEIRVADGTYVPTRRTDNNDNRSRTFSLVKGVKLLGGYADAPNSNVRTLGSTILSGDLQNDDVCTPHAPSEWCTLPFPPGQNPPLSPPLPSNWGECCGQAQSECTSCTSELCDCISRVLQNGSPNGSACCLGWTESCVNIVLSSCPCLCGLSVKGDNVYHVVTATGTDVYTELDGFVIRGGYAFASIGDDKKRGAGIHISGGGLKVKSCTFQGNEAERYGGGTYISGGSPIFENCVLDDNKAGIQGGGTYLDISNASFISTNFTANRAIGGSAQGGGAGYISGGSPSFTNCEFTSNHAVGGSERGAGLFLNNSGSGSPVAITGCHFTSNIGAEGTAINSATSKMNVVSSVFQGNPGSAVVIWSGKADFSDCSFSNNNAGSYDGGAIRARSSAVVSILDDTTFDGNIAANGGAIWSNGALVTVQDSHFQDNHASAGGGAIHVNIGELHVFTSNIQSNSTFGKGGGIQVLGTDKCVLDRLLVDDNYADLGGGIHIDKDASCRIVASVITNNGVSAGSTPLTTSQGGGVFASAGSIQDTVIMHNRASNFGGGFYGKLDEIEGNFVIANSLIAYNRVENTSTVEATGGGIHVAESGTMKIINCTVADNYAETRGGGIFTVPGSQPPTVHIVNSIFWNNPSGAGPQTSFAGQTTIEFSTMQGGQAEIDATDENLFWFRGNRESNPLFEGPFPTTLPGAYRLKTVPTASPCINKGDNGAVFGNADVAGDIRVGGCRVDMGAYESDSPNTAMPEPELAYPVITPKSRFISFQPGASGVQTAIRVSLDSLHHVVPPYEIPPSIPFTAFEGQERWAGPPTYYMESSSVQVPFRVSRLQCTPHFRNWGTEVLHVTGDAIVPSSSYRVQMFPQVFTQCSDRELGMFTKPLAIATGRWGDVISPFNPPAITTQPDIGDVQALVSKFRSELTAPIKARALLAAQDPWGNFDGPTITNDFNFSHIAACIDAFRGNSYPHQILPADAQPPGNTKGPVWCPCSDEANIRADVNGDGYIDADDDALEDLSFRYFVVNSDDDNENGVEDYLDVDGPFFAEDDLVELRLEGQCPRLDPNDSWWSLSCEGPGCPAMAIWDQYDKSDGEGGIATPLLMHSPYLWPPPKSLWLEARGTFESGSIVFNIDDSSFPGNNVAGGGCSCSGCGCDRTSFQAMCTPGMPRYYGGVQKKPNQSDITGIQAEIETCDISPGCYEHTSSNTNTNMGTLVHLNIGVDEPSWDDKAAWVQMGYRHQIVADWGNDTVYDDTYIEMQNGPDAKADYYLSSEDAQLGPLAFPSSGSHFYHVQHVANLQVWEFYQDNIKLLTKEASPYWQNKKGDYAEWRTELFNLQDKIPGDQQNPCLFDECKFQRNHQGYVEAFVGGHGIINDAPTQFTIITLSPKSFHMFDQSP